MHRLNHNEIHNISLTAFQVKDFMQLIVQTICHRRIHKHIKMLFQKELIPSGWAIFCMPVGAIMIGIETLKPKTVVLKSTLPTLIRIRGRNLFDLKIKKEYIYIYIHYTTWGKSFHWNIFYEDNYFWDDCQITREETSLQNSGKCKLVLLKIPRTGPLHQMHSSRKPSLAKFPLQLLHTQRHWLCDPSLQQFVLLYYPQDPFNLI